jgi:hypothetical protein
MGNKAVGSLIDYLNMEIEELRKDRDNCENDIAWKLINDIVIDKISLKNDLKECL